MKRSGRLLALLALALLPGCALFPLREVPVPTPVPCIAPEDLPRAPELAGTAELRAASDYQLVLLLWRDRKRAAGYTAELEAVAQGCAHIPVLPAAGATPSTTATKEPAP